VAFWGKKSTDIETREDKNSGPIRRLWRKIKNLDWKDPINRWKLLLASLIVCIVVFGGGYGVLSMTNEPTFCSSCHEMTPEYSTYTASAHSQISCVECHIKPGTINMMVHKVKTIKELYYHFTGVPNQIVQSTDEEVSNQNCLQCHSLNRVVTGPNGLKIDHQKHIDEGIPCVTCHSGVVHAQIASRNLNVAKDRDAWTKANADKLIQQQYLQPNMGLCIDCHNKVNDGQKPWLDPAYSVPTNPEDPGKATDTENSKTSKAEVQKVLSESINTKPGQLKISMTCTTCHSTGTVGIPKDHQTANFSSNHGTDAVNQLPQCLSCHQDSKWSRAVSTQDITTLLKYSDTTKKYVPNQAEADQEAKANTFCSTCHTKNNRPSQPST
jgi:cytochrome c-type protein NapC